MTVLVETPVAFAEVDAVPAAVRAVFTSALAAVGKRALVEFGVPATQVASWCEAVLLHPEDVLLVSAATGRFEFFVPSTAFTAVGTRRSVWVDDLDADGSSVVSVSEFGLQLRLTYPV